MAATEQSAMSVKESEIPTDRNLDRDLREALLANHRKWLPAETLSPERRKTLSLERREALRARFQLARSLVPILVPGVAALREYETATNAERAQLREQWRRQGDAAEDIEQRANALLRAIQKRKPSILAAVADGRMPQFCEPLCDPRTKQTTLAHLARGETGTHLSSRLVVEVTRLAAEAESWKHEARIKARGRRGRTKGSRQYLAEWVGLKLAQAGIELTTTETGAWARVLAVMYPAAGIAVAPYQFRDLHDALEFLAEEFPKLFPNRLQKSPLAKRQ